MSSTNQSRKSSKLASLLKYKGLKCFRNIKLCTTGNTNSANYEIMPYSNVHEKLVQDQQTNDLPIEIAKNDIQFVTSSKDFDDDFDNLVEMYYKQSLSNIASKSIISAANNNTNRTIENELNRIQPSHNSTQLGHDSYTSCCNSIYSDLSFKTTSENGFMPYKNKFTSTIIQDKSSNIDLYISASPSLSKINESNQDDSYDSLLESESSSSNGSGCAYSNKFYNSPVKSTNSSTSESSADYSYQCKLTSFSQNSYQLQQLSSINNHQFKSVTETFFDSNKDEELYVCCVSYEAKDNSEVTLDFADRVKIIYEKQDMVLVQNITNGQCGYVPLHCIISLDSFLNDLKLLSKQK
jgi:hypothetical protein